MRGGRSVLRAVPEKSLSKPLFFKSQAEFRKWLEKNHDKATELFLGLYHLRSGRGGITYKEAVDEALCFGWIDGVLRNIDEDSYMQRFTPRKKKSYWSAVNTKRFHELQKLGRVAEPGLRAFEARDASETQKYSFERETAAVFSPEFEKQFRANKKAWAFFEAQPPGYRRQMTFRVMSAKKEETRASRLRKLIEASEAGTRL
jgi:uncharacterized protein YdeI (YjbR/CyaY-like superfamily)